MISCPYCGTPNRRGSKYCSNCGQRLEAVSAITCTACERLNPPGSTYCAFCGALLTPVRPTWEGEESSKQKPESIEAALHRELPSWLYEQPATPSETATRPSAAPQAVAAQPRMEEQSKYLQDIQGVLPSTDTWLFSSMQRGIREVAPATDDATGKRAERRKGCLPLGLVAVWHLIGFFIPHYVGKG
ncbi:MAG: zinc ribbon domain-containing protein [Anaerolineae bacterium]